MRQMLRQELHEATLWLMDSFDQLAAEVPTPRGEARPSSAGQQEARSDRFVDDLCAAAPRGAAWHFLRST